ncbi:type II toxin-antitoxin system PemK/MazF family toxin [Candidatus Woesearchaeota archaeon]|nr:type II toxin-antitoxin system PemK/MazF family toxin [Candidatus Woesearchaeota archaeon]
MKVSQKDLVLLPYPFTDLERKKVRPALVISNDACNTRSADCMMVPLTTVMNDDPYSVIIEQKDLCSGTLIKQSRIRADKVFTVEKNKIIMKIGVLSDNVFDKIRLEIIKIVT